jgi:hypothetical protein
MLTIIIIIIIIVVLIVIIVIIKKKKSFRGLIPYIEDLKIINNTLTLEHEFVSIIRAGNCNLFGTHWFYVKKCDIPVSINQPKLITKFQTLSSDLLLGLHYTDLYLCDYDRKPLMKIPYSIIENWNGKNNVLSITIKNGNMKMSIYMKTPQSIDISKMLLDFMNMT